MKEHWNKRISKIRNNIRTQKMFCSDSEFGKLLDLEFRLTQLTIKFKI